MRDVSPSGRSGRVGSHALPASNPSRESCTVASPGSPASKASANARVPRVKPSAPWLTNASSVGGNVGPTRRSPASDRAIFQVGERDPLVAHPRSDDCGLDQGNGWSVAIVPQRPAPLLVEVELQAPDACQSGDPAPRRADQSA